MTTSEFFSLFTYASNWNIPLNIFFLTIAVIYLLLTGPLISKIPHAEPISPIRRVAFLFGLLLYYFSFGSPLNLLAHELFSMHMLQMSIQYIVMPPFLLMGLPGWFFRPFFRYKLIRNIRAFMTKPLIILFAFNGAISVYHVPVVFDFIMSDMMYHYISHVILVILALSMWWTVVCPVPELDKVKPLHKLGYIFANGVLLTPVCALVMFADQLLFESFKQMSTVAPIMSPRHDQVLGGVIMKIAQEVVYIIAMGFVFVRWFRAQRKKDEQEMLEWQQSTLDEVVKQS